MFLKTHSKPWGVLSQDVFDEFQQGEFGEIGRIVDFDTVFYPVVNFWGLRRTLHRSLLLYLNLSDWPFGSPVGKILRVLDKFEKIEVLNAIAYRLKGWRKLFVMLHLLRNWQISRYLKACEALLLVLERDLMPHEAADEVSKALYLINVYCKERASYPALPRHFGKHMGRVALWLVCPELLQIVADTNQITRPAFKISQSCLVSDWV